MPVTAQLKVEKIPLFVNYATQSLEMSAPLIPFLHLNRPAPLARRPIRLAKTTFGLEGGILVQKDARGYTRLAFINAGENEI